MKEKNTVIELSGREVFADSLTELLRTGARDLIQQAVEAELSEFMEQYSGRRQPDGHAAVVRNGYLPERAIQLHSIIPGSKAYTDEH